MIMNSRNILLFAAIMSVAPLSAFAQDNMRESFAVLTSQLKGREMHCTEKDDSGSKLLSQIDAYTIVVDADSRQFFDNALQTLRSDTLKAYSVLKADKGQQPLLFIGKGDINYKIGTSYDHYVCNLYDDTSNRGFRRAYAIEWNDEGESGISARVSFVYDKRPERLSNAQLSSAGMVVRTLGKNDSLTVSIKEVSEMMSRNEAVFNYLKNPQNADRKVWKSLVYKSLGCLEASNFGLMDYGCVAEIYGYSKYQPTDLSTAERRDIVSKIDRIIERMKDDAPMRDMLNAARKNLK